MTIAEFAQSKRISRQAVSKRYQKAGYKTADLTDADGQLTEYGVRILSEMFAAEPAKKRTGEDSARMQEMTKLVESLRQEIAELKKSLDELKKDRDAWREMAEQEKEQQARLTELMIKSADEVRELRRANTIPAKLSDGQHGRLWHWFHRSGDKQNDNG